MTLAAASGLLLLLGLSAFGVLVTERRSVIARISQVAVRPSARARLLVGAAALVAGGSAAIGTVWVIAWVASTTVHVPPVVVTSATIGLIVCAMRVTFVLAGALVRWTAGPPLDPERRSVMLPAWYWVTECLLVVVLCIAIGLLGSVWRPGVSFPLTLVGAVVFPRLYHAFIGPLFLRSRLSIEIARAGARPMTETVSALQLWLDEVAPRFGAALAPRILPLPGSRSFGAFAVKSEAVICLASDLLNVLGEPELRAVTAHEFAHIVRHDSRRRILIESGITFWYVMLYVWWVSWQSAIPGAARFVWLLVFAYVMQAVRAVLKRRGEFAADRMAAEILGDARPMIAALKKTAALQGSLSRRSQSHPSFAARIAALERLS